MEPEVAETKTSKRNRKPRCQNLFLRTANADEKDDLQTIKGVGPFIEEIIYTQKVAHSMLFVIFAFLAIAGIFILLGAEFLAAIQILVYIASVGLVVLFGIMLTRRQILEEDFE